MLFGIRRMWNSSPRTCYATTTTTNNHTKLVNESATSSKSYYYTVKKKKKKKRKEEEERDKNKGRLETKKKIERYSRLQKREYNKRVYKKHAYLRWILQ